jgi:hypothetical protein
MDYGSSACFHGSGRRCSPGRPGNDSPFSGLVLAARAEDFRHVGLGKIFVLVLLTILTYIIDIAAAAFGARQFGAGRRAATDAALGAVIFPQWDKKGPSFK